MKTRTLYEIKPLEWKQSSDMTPVNFRGGCSFREVWNARGIHDYTVASFGNGWTYRVKNEEIGVSDTAAAAKSGCEVHHRTMVESRFLNPVAVTDLGWTAVEAPVKLDNLKGLSEGGSQGVLSPSEEVCRCGHKAFQHRVDFGALAAASGCCCCESFDSFVKA